MRIIQHGIIAFEVVNLLNLRIRNCYDMEVVVDVSDRNPESYSPRSDERGIINHTYQLLKVTEG